MDTKHEHEQVRHARMKRTPEQVNLEVNAQCRQNRFGKYRARERDKNHQQEENRIPDLIEARFTWQFLEKPRKHADNPFPVEGEVNEERQCKDKTNPLVIGDARCARDVDGDEEDQHNEVKKEFELGKAEFFISGLHGNR